MGDILIIRRRDVGECVLPKGAICSFSESWEAAIQGNILEIETDVGDYQIPTDGIVGLAEIKEELNQCVAEYSRRARGVV